MLIPLPAIKTQVDMTCLQYPSVLRQYSHYFES